MELEHKKNLSASIYVDNVKLMDLNNSSVYGKFDDNTNDAYFLFKNDQNGRSIKMIIQKTAEEVEKKDI